MTQHRFFTLDVFTDQPFAGNQLAVFPEAANLDERWMQSIAREFNLSETVFVLPPANPASAARFRIFTPAAELPFAGHPTIGAVYLLAELGRIPAAGVLTEAVVEEGVGLVPVRVHREGERPGRVELSPAKLPVEGEVPSRESLAEVLGIRLEEIRDDEHRPEAWTCGLPFIFVPLTGRDVVARVKLHVSAAEKHLVGAIAQQLYVFSVEGRSGASEVHARMFAPLLGVAEDPATGSAVAAMAGYLGRRCDRRGAHRWRIEQGVEMGRPSLLDLEADFDGDALVRVRVGGRSVIVSEGTLRV